MPTIQFKRGSTAQLPDSGAAGEPIFDMEKGQLWIGTGSSRVLINTDEYVLPEVGTPGTYVSVTTDENGRVISGTTTIPSSKVTGLGTAATKNIGTASGNVPVIGSNGKIDSTLIGGGHADTADKLKTPRSIALTGGATGTATNFDGSANISIPVTGLDASKLTSGTVPPERLSPDPGVYSINPVLGPSSVLYTSTIQPTLAEIGAVDSTFTNKIAFYPYENALCEISSDGGTTWTTDTSMTESKWKLFVSENNNANIKIAPDKQYRITVTSKSYCYLSALYLYANTNGNKISIKIEKYNNTTAIWSNVITQSNDEGGSPTHIWAQHSDIPFNTATTSNGYYGKIRLTIIPTILEGFENNLLDLRGLRWYGGYPGTDHRTIYSWDEDKNVTFPAQLKASEVYDNGQRVYSPVNKPTAVDVTGLGTAATKNTGTTSGTIPLLSTNGKLPETMIPKIAITDVYTVDSAAELITLSGAQVGDVGIVNNTTNPAENNTYILALEPYSTASNWKPMSHPTDAVTSVNGKTGVVVVTKADVGLGNVLNVAQIPATEKGAVSGVATLDTNGKLTPTQKPTYTKADVGLGNVDNTSDLNKPLSTATTNALALKANLASPTFTGTPKAPTAAKNTNTTQLATTAFVIGQASTVAPLGWAELGVVGESLLYARADHQHPAPSIIDGGIF